MALCCFSTSMASSTCDNIQQEWHCQKSLMCCWHSQYKLLGSVGLILTLIHWFRQRRVRLCGIPKMTGQGTVTHTRGNINTCHASTCVDTCRTMLFPAAKRHRKCSTPAVHNTATHDSMPTQRLLQDLCLNQAQQPHTAPLVARF